MTTQDQARWEAWGSVRGSCGHSHTLAEAEACAAEDIRAIGYGPTPPTAQASVGGRSYSDRMARCIPHEDDYCLDCPREAGP